MCVFAHYKIKIIVREAIITDRPSYIFLGVFTPMFIRICTYLHKDIKLIFIAYNIYVKSRMSGKVTSVARSFVRLHRNSG